MTQTTDEQLKALGAMTLLEIHAQIELRDNRLIAAYTEIDSLKAVINKLLEENAGLRKQIDTLYEAYSHAAGAEACNDNETLRKQIRTLFDNMDAAAARTVSFPTYEDACEAARDYEAARAGYGDEEEGLE